MTYKMNMKTFSIMGILIAMEIVLSRFFSIQSWNMKIGFSFLPVVTAAILFGAMEAGMVAAISDIIGAMLFPSGVFFPGFTVTSFLTGFMFGLLLNKKTSLPKIVLSVVITQVCCSLFLNTMWISIMFQSPYWALFIPRIYQVVVMTVVQIVTIYILNAQIIPLLKRIMK